MGDEDQDYGLVMPFTVTQSHGGPFEDEAFCAGWKCGQLDELASGGAERIITTVLTATVPQVDLIAMRHGYTLEANASDDYPEWTHVEMTKAAEVIVDG